MVVGKRLGVSVRLGQGCINAMAALSRCIGDTGSVVMGVRVAHKA